jgi:ATP-dependent DNA ligase
MVPHILPMLAVAAEPFDSREYSFEIKYDGVRALAAVEEGGWRLWGRQGADYASRYPELDVLGRLPAGTLVDGKAFYHQVVAAGQEGILAKPRTSGYRPGKRCNAWKKIKPRARNA